MKDYSKQITEFLAHNPKRQYKSKELARAMNITQENYQAFRDFVKDLAREGKIAKHKHNHFGHQQHTSMITGILHVKTQGYGFLIVGDGKEDVFISQKNMGTAMNRDTVKVQLFAQREGSRQEGRVLEVVKRGRLHIVGILHKGKLFNFVKPDDVKLLQDIVIPDENLNGAKPGQKVAVTIERWEDESLSPEGKVAKVLGFPSDPGVDVLSVAFAFDLPATFPHDVEREAEALSLNITPELLRNRLDLREHLIFTVDPFDAKDFDDAVHLIKLKNGNYELGVHIADVSHYVRESSVLDKEALQRATSVYLVDRVVPMLPENLSNELCSLKPEVDRLTYSCIMEVTPDGEVVNYKISESIIHSKRRFTYEEVQEIIEGKANAGKALDASIKEMEKLRQILTAHRMRNGSLDFDLPEMKVILDDQGHPIEIRRKVRLNSMRLIEEFMLLANQTVAQHVSISMAEQGLKAPFIYRVHERPSPEKIEEFGKFVKALGYSFDYQQKITPKLMSRFLEKISGQPEADIIENVMLRSLMKARYDTANLGHFGLAFKHYSHFTSPIRRYPDLIAHRMLKAYARDYQESQYESFERKLHHAAQQSSEREIVALEAERASIKMKQVEFMSTRLGEEYDGIISGVVSFGIFVEITEFMVEGLVHISDLEDDYYLFEEKAYRLKGRSSGRVYRLGDKVRVRVVRVNVNERLLDFVLVERKREKEKKKIKQRKR